MGPNLEHHLLFCSQNPSHNAIKEEFGTSLSMKFGKANTVHGLQNLSIASEVIYAYNLENQHFSFKRKTCVSVKVHMKEF